MRASAAKILALAALLLAAPELASACAVCTGGQTEEVQYAFIWTTGFMSLMPLILVGGLVWYLRRRVRELAEKQAQREPEPVPIAPGGLRRSSR